MKDFIQRFTLEHTDLRGEIVHLNKSFYTIMEQHYYPEPVRKFLGQVLLAAVLLRGIIKFKGQLSIQLETEGEIEMLVAQCNDEYHVRAVAQYNEEADLTDLEQSLEQGKLVVTIMPDSRVDPYQAIVSLQQHQSVSQAIEFYFKQSEQIPTRLRLQVEKEHAVGLLLQKLPDSAEHQGENWSDLIAKLDEIKEHDLFHLEPEQLLLKLYGDNAVRMFKPREVMFHCHCSIEKMATNIRLLGKADAYDLLRTNRYITVTCEFCNHEHDFERGDVDEIFQNPEVH